MDDQTKTTEEQVEQSLVHEEAQASPDVAGEGQGETQGQEQVPNQGGDIKSSGGEEKSRLEKRIESLEEKLLGVKSPQDRQKISSLIERLKSRLNPTGVDPSIFKTEPLIKEEELETGIDPNVLEQRQRDREMALKEQAKAEIRAEIQFIDRVKDHIADYEQTIATFDDINPKSEKYDKKLGDFITKQYWLANNVYNPLTGNYEFVPTVKTSEIVKQVKDIIESKVASAQADAAGKLADDISSSSLSPKLVSDSSNDLEEEALMAKAKESGSDEDWAEVLKKRLNLKS